MPPTTAARLAELLALLPDALKADAAGAEALAGLLEPVARIDNYLTARREKLLQLHDPTLLDDELVPFLAAHLGLGPDLPATATLSIEELRALLPSLVALWKRKGTGTSYRDVVAALAGLRALLLTWFELRWITDRVGSAFILPDVGELGGLYSYPEQVVDLWYFDPTQDLDVSGFAAMLDAMRQSGERINLRSALFIDDMLHGPGLWSPFEGNPAPITFDDEAHTLTIGPGDAVVDLGAIPDSWSNYAVALRASLSSEGGYCHLYATGTAAAPFRYEVHIELLNQLVQIHRDTSPGGFFTHALLASAPLAQELVPGQVYDWRFEVFTNTDHATVRAFCNGHLLLEAVSNDANELEAGGVLFNGGGGTGGMVVHSCLIYAMGAAVTRIGPTP